MGWAGPARDVTLVMSQPVYERTRLRPESWSDPFPLEKQGSRATIAPPGSSPAEARRRGPDKGRQGSLCGATVPGAPRPTCPCSSAPLSTCRHSRWAVCKVRRPREWPGSGRRSLASVHRPQAEGGCRRGLARGVRHQRLTADGGTGAPATLL